MQETLNEIKNQNKNQGYCKICGNLDNHNMCVSCNAVIDARRMAGLYFIDLLRKTKANYTVDEIKQSFYDKRKKLIIKYVCPGINGLSKEERELFWKKFYNEIDKLESNIEHAARVMHYDLNNDRFYTTDIDITGDLKNAYLFKNRLRG